MQRLTRFLVPFAMLAAASAVQPAQTLGMAIVVQGATNQTLIFPDATAVHFWEATPTAPCLSTSSIALSLIHI